ncbi:MAG TPA: hypothetical protein VI524_01125 [Anaerolineales bacterium]|nr:hypothetical protein [Anaerolineales bacterium]
MNDEFDFEGRPSRPQTRPMQVWDVLSVLVLIVTACLAVYFVFIFLRPDSPFNFLPPGGRGPRLPTATVTPLQLQPTWTASPTLELTPSDTPRPTFTPFSTNTPFSLVPPTKTARPTSTPRAPFSVTVNFRPSTIFYPELACSYFIIGGEAVDVQNSPFYFGIVKIGGTLNGHTIDPEMHTTVTGVATQFGPAGFEIKLPEAPLVNSNETLWIQMFDTALTPLSDRKYFNTYNDCERNLIHVRFKATR